MAQYQSLKAKALRLVVEGLAVCSNWGDSRLTFVNGTASASFVRLIIPERLAFPGDAVLQLVERGRYANTRALRDARHRTNN